MKRWFKFHCGLGFIALGALASDAVHPLFKRGLGWETEAVTFIGLMALFGIGWYLLRIWFLEKHDK